MKKSNDDDPDISPLSREKSDQVPIILHDSQPVVLSDHLTRTAPRAGKESGYLFTKDLTTTIKISFLLYTQLNATRPQIRMEVLLHAGIISFDHFKIYD
jgi:hypothetical protein